MMTTPTSIFVTKYYPKFVTLKEMTMEAFSGSTADEVNIYLDLTDMTSKLYSPYVSIQKPLEIAAAILNLCAHFRDYYTRFHSVWPKFFLIFSGMGNTYNCNLVPGYNQAYMDKLQANLPHTNAIAISMDMLKMICPYLPDIFYREDIYEPTVVIYNTILDQHVDGNNAPNIIITREPLAYQLPASLPDTAIFKDDKKLETYATITQQSVFMHYLYDTGRIAIANDPNIQAKLARINPELLGTFITLTNLPSRGVKSLMSVNKTINTLLGIIDRGIIPNAYVNNIPYLYSSIFNGLSKVSLDMFTLRFRAIDLIAGYQYYINTPFALNSEYKQNLNDPQAIQEINNTYFKDTPIDLNRL